jgi:hypothetical protein
LGDIWGLPNYDELITDYQADVGERVVANILMEKENLDTGTEQ